MERLGKPITNEEETSAVGDSVTSDSAMNDSKSHQGKVEEEVAKFVVSKDTGHLRSNFSLQASLASQVRLLASQRTRQDEDIIGDSEDEESTGSPGSTSESSFVEMWCIICNHYPWKSKKIQRNLCIFSLKSC